MTVRPILAYVAGAYRDPRGHYYVEQNIRAAETLAVSLWQRGIPTLTPHLNTRGFDGAAPDEVWLAGDLVMLARCDVMVLVPGWRRSAGSRAEFVFAHDRGIPAFEADSAEFDAWLSEQGPQ